MTFAFEAIGTHWKIDIHDDLSDQARSDIFSCVQDRIETYDKNYSRFRADSLVTEMSQRAGVFTLPDDAKPLFDLYEKLFKLTNGLVTPLIGNLLSSAGYDATYSFKTKPLHVPPTWDEALGYAFPKLEIKQPVLLDVGAAGKGYLIDLIAEFLLTLDLHSFVINAGGDILHVCPDNVLTRVALEDPCDTTKAIGVVQIGRESICGSAGNRRVWESFHHIINPFTLTSPNHISAVWVIANSALLADALTTCLFFTEPEILAKEFDFQYVILRADYSVDVSKNFKGELFVAV